MLLGIDIGTSSSKGVLVRPDGSVAASATRDHAVSTPRPGWVEHDALAVWWADLVSLAGELGAAGPVDAVAVSGIGPCLLPAGLDGAPLRPAILYGVDTRATRQIAAQNEALGADAVLARCHSPLTTQAIGPKLAWLREQESDVYARSRRWFMASSYLGFRLTGEYVLDHHSASQSVPLYDPVAHEWIAEWCERIAPGLDWPRLVWPADVIGSVTPDAATATGLSAGIPVVAGTIDAWAEAVSVGVADPGDLMLMYGTTMFLVNVTEQAHPSPVLWSTVGAFPDTYSLAGGMATSGAVTAWLAELTGAGFETLTNEAAAIPPGAEGLLMLPYFAGERTPLFDPDARGVVAGLTLRHTRGHLYRAALEATAFGVRHNLEAMSGVGAPQSRLVAVGGGTTGGLWTQIVTDVIGRPQERPAYTVGAAYGDAFLAALATGKATPPDIRTWNPIATVIEPAPPATEIYDERYAHYRELYPATVGIVHALAQS
jgi:xylulokinase